MVLTPPPPPTQDVIGEYPMLCHSSTQSPSAPRSVHFVNRQDSGITKTITFTYLLDSLFASLGDLGENVTVMIFGKYSIHFAITSCSGLNFTFYLNSLLTTLLLPVQWKFFDSTSSINASNRSLIWFRKFLQGTLHVSMKLQRTQ